MEIPKRNIGLAFAQSVTLEGCAAKAVRKRGDVPMSRFDGLQLVWLETFVEVAESGKRWLTAKELNITQSTVTKHIQKLEHWLGDVMLLDANGKLMPDGIEFLPDAVQVLGLLQDARHRPAAIRLVTVPAGSGGNPEALGRGRTPTDD